LEERAAVAKYFAGEAPDYVSLEGYVAAGLLAEGLRRAGPQLDTEKVVEALENVRDFDLGLGTRLSFGRTEHQGSHKVWGTQLDEAGRYQAIDLQCRSPPDASRSRGRQLVGLERDDFIFESSSRSSFLVEHDLFRRPPPTPDQVRGRLFRDHALALGENLQPARCFHRAQALGLLIPAARFLH